MADKAKYDLSTVTVKATTAEILALMGRIEDDDLFGEFRSGLVNYLPFEQAKPYLKEGVTEGEWIEAVGTDPDARLRQDFEHYREWWKQKIEDERGISVWRGKSQFALRMFLAGMPEWKELYEMDGGYYTRDAYRFARELCGLATLDE